MGIEVYMTKIIYFADDEKNIRDLVVPFLEHDGFTVRAFETGDLLLEAYKNQKPDLVILDIMMPGTNGLDVMKSIRQYDNIPIIMLTARDSDVDFITAFNLGTDDYFTKPFSPIKLSLHVKALFKRLDEKAIKNDTQYQFLDLTLDTEKRIALLSNEEMPLTKTEFDFLLVLIEKPETAFSRETLLNRIWGFDDIESRAVDDTIKRLRKKFKQYHSQVSIKTVWGYGFKLIKEDK
ncbi:response regulator receiver domain protein [Streptococcus agalactiae]|nr:response regulator receiver domain protein [Streptococcus agalactiae]KXA51500.1 response regulator receiver domain protein [Streptococcus agalactiae]BBN23448.1 DNA-binding response regulator [Streptococcus agalactiae]